MRWMKSVLQEVWGLFVDDGSFALAILAWVAVTGLVLPRLGVTRGMDGILLFAGLALILVESAWRRAGK